MTHVGRWLTGESINRSTVVTKTSEWNKELPSPSYIRVFSLCVYSVFLCVHYKNWFLNILIFMSYKISSRFDSLLRFSFVFYRYYLCLKKYTILNWNWVS
jgi:hypothetical protein